MWSHRDNSTTSSPTDTSAPASPSPPYTTSSSTTGNPNSTSSAVSPTTTSGDPPSPMTPSSISPTEISSTSSTTTGTTSIANVASAATTRTTSAAPTKTASAAAVTNSSHVSDGVIAGSVVGGTIFLALLILGIILFCRSRRRKHIAPSSEFAETIKRGEMPVLRLDSGIEFVPPTPHHVPLPLRQNTYHTSPSIPDMKSPVGMMWSDAQSARYSLQKPLQPLRYPVHKESDDSGMTHPVGPAHMGSSIDDSQEYWSGEPGNIETRRELVSQSPDPSYSPLMQNTYPMEQSQAVETVQNAYVDLWKLSVAPGAQSRPSSGQALPPLLPVRRSVDVRALPPLVPVRRSVDIGQR